MLVVSTPAIFATPNIFGNRIRQTRGTRAFSCNDGSSPILKDTKVNVFPFETSFITGESTSISRLVFAAAIVSTITSGRILVRYSQVQVVLVIGAPMNCQRFYQWSLPPIWHSGSVKLAKTRCGSSMLDCGLLH